MIRIIKYLCSKADKLYASGSVCIKHVDEDALEPVIIFGATPWNPEDD
jgi:hypothetical protein